MSTVNRFAEIAALAGEPARAAMLDALMDGRALTAAELARHAGVTAQSASGHLSRLLCADLVNEGILTQSSFSEVDRYCSPARQTAMLLTVMDFIRLAEKAVQAGTPPAQLARLPLYARLQRLGEEFGEDQIKRLELVRRQLAYEVESISVSGAHES